MVAAMVSSLKSCLNNIHSAYTESITKTPSSHVDPAKMLSRSLLSVVGANEIDAVLLLEWISKLVRFNECRAGVVVWPLVHEYLCSVFEEKIDLLCVQVLTFCFRTHRSVYRTHPAIINLTIHFYRHHS